MTIKTSQDEQVSPVKKVWNKPDLYFIATGYIQGGASPGVHEQNVDHSSFYMGTTGSGAPRSFYKFHTKNMGPFSWSGHSHKKTFYNS